MGFLHEGYDGLKDDYDFTIESALFAPDAGYKSGEVTLLQWLGTGTDGEETWEDHIWWPTGPDWRAIESGRAVACDAWPNAVFVDGGPKSGSGKFFTKTSLLYKVIARCVEDFGMGEFLEARGTAFEAATWEGLTFHVLREPTFAGTHLMPVAYVGAKAAGGAGTSAPISSATTDAAAKLAAIKAGNTNGHATNGATSLREQAIAIIKSAPDFATAQNLVVNLDGITGEPALVDEIMNESGLYAQVKAGAVA